MREGTLSPLQQRLGVHCMSDISIYRGKFRTAGCTAPRLNKCPVFLAIGSCPGTWCRLSPVKNAEPRGDACV